MDKLFSDFNRLSGNICLNIKNKEAVKLQPPYF